MKSAFFISDLHFGADYAEAHPDRETHFCNFLEKIKPEASHVFIVGDLFEFWMEYQYYIPKKHFNLLAKLGSLTENGVKVYYLSGNHDFNLGTFFNQHLGIKTCDVLDIEVQGLKLHLLHGDGMAQTDGSYRLLKKVIRAPLSNFLFKLLHPDWGMALAEWVGKTSRGVPRKGKKAEYQQAANETIQEIEGANAIIHGHTHRFFIREIAENKYHINTGEWLKNLQYIKLTEGKFSLNTYQP